ncbi:MAG: AMP-binding protein [Sulfurospirillum sp.]|nr:AMP-binding protein [Sulfurospirillum sp.]MBL0703149.1 AMP-binding protein [Sulfurospirillum sp.]
MPTLFHMLINVYSEYKNNTAFIYRVKDKTFEVTYKKFFNDVLILSRAFGAKGIKKGVKVVFVCDNRYEWIVTDMALVSLGAISVPKESSIPVEELEFITKNSEASFLILESESVYHKCKEMIKSLKLKSIFIIEAEKLHTIFDHIYSYNDMFVNREIYRNEIEEFMSLKDNLSKDDIFTIIYTSGTTGMPKGVILIHKNVMQNVKVLPSIVELKTTDLWVSILPPWHIFERTCEYSAISGGSTMIYSTIRTFAEDLVKFKPTLVATVPRLWESMYAKINSTLEKKDPKKAKIFKKLILISAKYNYNLRIVKDELPRFKKENIGSSFKKLIACIKLLFLYMPNKFAKNKLKLVQEKFGGRLRLAISGGGTLPDFLDEWIDALGIRIVNAYGMTECAPAISLRALNCNTFSTLGLPVEGTKLYISDENEENCEVGEVGEIVLKGDQVTPGYYNNDEENKKAFTKNGYFKTGDLGKLTIRNELIITGRSKEVIILASGENVDPSRIESAISLLPFVKDTILVGQDKKGLGMLLVPDFEKLKEYVHENFDKVVHSIEQVLEDKHIINKLKSDMNKLVHPKKGFKSFEKLQNIHFVEKEFAIGEELTNTFKKKRHVIENKYKEVIDKFLT